MGLKIWQYGAPNLTPEDLGAKYGFGDSKMIPCDQVDRYSFGASIIPGYYGVRNGVGTSKIMGDQGARCGFEIGDRKLPEDH